MTPPLVLAQPGTAVLDEIALGLQRSDLLAKYLTTYQFDPSGRTAWVLDRTPGKLGSLLRREAGRRSNAGLDPAKVVNNLDLEVPRLLAERTGIFRARVDATTRWRNRHLGSRVARELRRDRPEVFAASDGCAHRPFEAASELGIPKILIQTIARVEMGHEIMEEEARAHPEFGSLLPFISEPPSFARERSQEQLMADRVVVGSEFAGESLIAYGVPRERVRVIPYGTDPDRFRPPAMPSSRERPRFLFVGQMSQRKGIKYLLEAARTLDLPADQLVMLGGLHCDEAALAPYRDHFTHVANVPYSELDSHYRDADVFVYPSLFEGSAVATYEAMASGLPMITTFNTGSVARDGIEGRVVPIRDAAALTAAMSELAEDRDLRLRFGAAARERAKGFTWRAHHEALAATVEELLAPQPA